MLEKAYSKIPKNLVDLIIVCDDSSNDNTVEISRGLGLATYTNDISKGYGGNIKFALNKAFELGADFAVEIHGDGAQFNPKSINEAIPMMKENYDLILGSRFIVPGLARKNGMPLIRYLANIGLSFFDRLILRLQLSEFHTGFRIYSRNFYNVIPLKFNSNGYLLSFEVIAQSAYFDMKVGEIPVEADYLSEHTSHKIGGAILYAFQTFYILFNFLLIYILQLRPLYIT
jgi:glycosyltransferase involved in cell wall biosynthesis